MPAVARKDETETVNTVHVSVGDKNPLDTSICDLFPTTTNTDKGSSTVFAEGVGVVRVDDAVKAHTFPPSCATHTPGLAVGSSNVFVEGKGIGRKDDTYGCGAKIITGADTVFANGD